MLKDFVLISIRRTFMPHGKNGRSYNGNAKHSLGSAIIFPSRLRLPKSQPGAVSLYFFWLWQAVSSGVAPSPNYSFNPTAGVGLVISKQLAPASG